MSNPFTEDDRPRHAFEWGLASLLTAGVLLIMIPGTISIILNLFVGGLSYFSSSDKAILFYATCALAVFSSGACLFSIICGFVSWYSAISNRQPAALATAGIVAGVFALALWITASIVALSVQLSHR